MSNIKQHIGNTLQASRFAVLATEGNGQPHASLIAITPFEGFSSIIFATYRKSGKYRNILQNGKVAILVEGENTKLTNLQKGFVITAFGQAGEISVSEHDVAFSLHLDRHRDLDSLMQSEDCALIQVKIESYQVVNGTEDVRWYTMKELNAF